jgi:hypothetical protein
MHIKKFVSYPTLLDVVGPGSAGYEKLLLTSVIRIQSLYRFVIETLYRRYCWIKFPQDGHTFPAFNSRMKKRLHYWASDHTHTCMYAYINTHMYIRIHLCMHTYAHMYIHECIHARIRTYLHTYTHVRTYIHTYLTIVHKLHIRRTPEDGWLCAVLV